MNDNDRKPTKKPPLTTDGVTTLIVGALLMLAPGGCSLYWGYHALIAKYVRPDLGEEAGATLLLAICAVGLLVAAGGFALARAGLRKREQR
mgnify:CR=1 FL=1